MFRLQQARKEADKAETAREQVKRRKSSSKIIRAEDGVKEDLRKNERRIENYPSSFSLINRASTS
jgi:hypothetical protein